MKRSEWALLILFLVVTFLVVNYALPVINRTEQAQAQQATPTSDPHPAPTASLTSTKSNGSDSVVGPPSVTAAFIDALLCRYQSPACGIGQTLHRLGVQYQIDPVFPLAFFYHESSLGKQGVATASKSIGNLRCVPQAMACPNHFAYFASWEDGAQAWYILIAGPLYVGAGLTTLQTILPKYAPAGDGNFPNHYIAAVRTAVVLWRAGKVALP
jgi:hypothetical protein